MVLSDGEKTSLISANHKDSSIIEEENGISSSGLKLDHISVVSVQKVVDLF